MSQIIFLGTGGGRIVLANQLTATGGFVIQLAGHQIHLEPGPGALVRAKQYGVRANKTDIIFVSHHHIDHVNDLNVLVDAITLGGIHEKGIVISTPTVLSGGNDELAWLQPMYRKKLKECFAIRPGDNVKVGNLTFTATKTKHDVEHSMGLILESSALKIGYTGDTSNFPELAEIYKDVDILILNVLRPAKDKWKTHLCSNDAAKIIEKVQPRLAIIQHYGAKMLRAKPIYEARTIQQKTGVRTIAAMDGMKIDLKTFTSEKGKQTKLEA